MPVTQADIQAEKERRAMLKKGSSFGGKALDAADAILPYAVGTAGALAGMGAAALPAVIPGGQPIAATLPFLGAVAGFSGTKQGLRAIREVGGYPPQETFLGMGVPMGPGLESTMRDFATGVGIEFAPKAALSAVKGTVGLAAKGAKAVSPTILHVLGNVPKEITKYAMEHPAEVLKMNLEGARQTIDSGLRTAMSIFQRHAETKRAAGFNKIAQLNEAGRISTGKLAKTLQGTMEKAGTHLRKARLTEGIIPTQKEQITINLGKTKAIKTPDSGITNLDAFAKKIDKMNPVEAFRKLVAHDAEIAASEKMVSKEWQTSKNFPSTIGLVRSQVQNLMKKIPIDEATKASEMAYMKGIESAKVAQNRFFNQYYYPKPQEIQETVAFLSDNYHRMEPREAYRTALSARMAMDRGFSKEFKEYPVESLRKGLNQVIERIPGFERLKTLDKVYAAAAEGERVLGEAVKSQTKLENFLDSVFARDSVDAPKKLELLLALEKKTGKDSLPKLQRMWEEKEIVRKAVYPFEKEFADIGTAEKFVRGLLTDGGKTIESREALRYVKKVLGTQLVSDIMKGMSAETLLSAEPRPYYLTKGIGSIAGAMGMFGMFGNPKLLPYAAMTGAVAAASSPQTMRHAMRAGYGIGRGAVSAATNLAKPGRLMGLGALKGIFSEGNKAVTSSVDLLRKMRKKEEK